MKTKKELEVLSNNISKAIFAYRQAIFDNLKESNGKEFDIESDDEDDHEKGIRLTTIGRHNDAILLLIDKIRFNPNRGLEGVIEVHIAEDDYKDCDYWMLACEFGDDEEYIYNNIIW